LALVRGPHSRRGDVYCCGSRLGLVLSSVRDNEVAGAQFRCEGDLDETHHNLLSPPRMRRRRRRPRISQPFISLGNEFNLQWAAKCSSPP